MVSRAVVDRKSIFRLGWKEKRWEAAETLLTRAISAYCLINRHADWLYVLVLSAVTSILFA